MLFHGFSKSTQLKIFIITPPPLYIRSICWLCLFHTLTFDKWATIWVLAFIHCLDFFKQIGLETIKIFCLQSPKVMLYICHVSDSIWNQYDVFGFICNVIKKNMITRDISRHTPNTFFYEIYIYSSLSDSSVECDQLYKFILISLIIWVKYK